MTTDYSVECALPYTLEFAGLQPRFEQAFSDLTHRVRESGKTFHRVLLVDDVTNEAGEGLDLDAYRNASANNETFIMKESLLNTLSEALLNQVELPDEEIAKLKTEVGFSSPFYIATWTLLRLGYLKHPDFPTEQVSSKVVNILPESFREGEEESLKIISHTPFAHAVRQIEYIYV